MEEDEAVEEDEMAEEEEVEAEDEEEEEAEEEGEAEVSIASALPRRCVLCDGESGALLWRRRRFCSGWSLTVCTYIRV